MGIIERKNPSLVTLGQRFLSNWTVTGNFAGKKTDKGNTCVPLYCTYFLIQSKKHKIKQGNLYTVNWLLYVHFTMISSNFLTVREKITTLSICLSSLPHSHKFHVNEKFS